MQNTTRAYRLSVIYEIEILMSFFFIFTDFRNILTKVVW